MSRIANTPGHRRGDDPHAVAHVATVARQVGHQLHEERHQREQHEAAVQRPVVALPLAGDHPAGQQQQRQREREADAEDARARARRGRARTCRARASRSSSACRTSILRCPAVRPSRLRVDAPRARSPPAPRARRACRARGCARVTSGSCVRVGGGRARGDPVAEALLRRVVGGLAGEREGRAPSRSRSRRRERSASGMRPAASPRPPGRRVDELVEREFPAPPRQVAHDLAAQADQELREDERDTHIAIGTAARAHAAT